MIGSLFLQLTRHSGFRRMAWKPIYELLATVLPLRNWRFMNYGYSPGPHELPVLLQPEDEEERLPLQLYHYLATKGDMNGKDVLEVGCGRGGGSYYMARYLAPRSLTGLDLAEAAIAFCRKHWQHPSLRFVRGDAEDLPFPDQSFDVVINVESSHAYGSFPQFLSEVKRVLRPNGILLITDMRLEGDLPVMQEALHMSGMKVVEEEDITHLVVKAIEEGDKRKRVRIRKLVPWWLTGFFQEFAGVKGSAIHLHMKDRRRLYYRWKLIA